MKKNLVWFVLAVSVALTLDIGAALASNINIDDLNKWGTVIKL